MHKWQKFVVTGSIVASTLALSTPFAFATTNVASGLTLQPGQTSITLTVPNLDSQLQPSPTLSFQFTPVDSSVGAMTTTGSYISGSTDEYTVPIPNFGKQETVNIAVGYSYNGVNYTATAGPLIDTLPEAPLAALLPIGMLGVFYITRKRRAASQQM